jgi:hypothetical protein
MRSRARRIRRSLQIAAAIGISLLVALPDAAFAVTQKSLDQMSQAELDRFVQQLNETANWRKYRRPNDPPDFVPGKPVKVMHGAGASMGRGGARGGNFRRGGLANRRSAKSKGRNRNDAMAQDRGSSRSRSNSSSSSSSRSSFGNSRSNGGSNFGNSGNSGFEE